MAEPAPSLIRPSPRRDRWRDTTLPLTLLIGDSVVTFAGLSLGYFLRYETAVGRIGLDVPDATFARYLPLLLVGVGLLVAAFVQFGLYDTRLLLRRYQNLNAILKGASVWLVAYLGLSLVLKFDPPISRLFVLLAFGAVVVLLYGWRSLVYALLTRTSVLSRLRRRAVVFGWNDEARTLADEIASDPTHPFVLAGIVTRADTTPPFAAPPAEPSSQCNVIRDTGSEHAPWLGTSEQLMKKFRIFYVLIALMVLFSCQRNRNNIIPNVLVDIEININNPSYLNLMAVGGSMYLSGGSRGIVVYRYSQDEFVAFDRHCPYNPEDACGQVIFDTSSAIILKDNCCGSQFLLTDGSIYSGPATNSLKRYQTFFDGTILRIYN